MIQNLPVGVDAYVHTLIGAVIVIVIVTTNAKAPEINSIAVNLMIFWPLSNRKCHSSRGGGTSLQQDNSLDQSSALTQCHAHSHSNNKDQSTPP